MAEAGFHTDVSLKTFPARCSLCDALQQAPLACADCHDLLEHVQGADYFELFGLARTYDVVDAELNAKYLAISRNIHPDRFTANDDTMQRFALRASAQVNKAYATLRDPFLRAEYLLESNGGRSASQDKRVPPALLAEVMLLREELEEARERGDDAAVAAMAATVKARRDATQVEIARLCGVLTGGGGDSVRDDLRMQLNAMKYYANLMTEIAAPRAAARP